ncbi:MAG TPA: type I-U CRISPR-associated helicase/endonuclease Cas3 [Isosphaeraceae bacterium]|nr:type I-U CRISPR-associated helicase/endonuclease Cas3 [Isosphaeraceae bacterium]
MTSLQPDQFPSFFRALNGYEPFPWQDRLARQVADGDWPACLALPTASGKTACIDIAVFALACQSGRPPAERTAARRIFFVVDRRVIVDEAFERAKRVAQRLRTGVGAGGAKESVLIHAADALRRSGGLAPDDHPLACVQLRGGIYRDQAWARTPTQPTVLASTVDQIGSRLLFRGYGVSNSLQPVHAGLSANDALILLDEAHCSRPFLQTASALRGYRQWGSSEAPSTPFHFVVLSATPPAGMNAAAVLRLEDDDLKPEFLGLRVLASKPVSLSLEEVPGGTRGGERFAARLVDHAAGMIETHGLMALAIMVNRVATARLVEALCRRRWPNEKAHVLCLTGRMRPLDRDRFMHKWKETLKAQSRPPTLDRPVIVATTQCLEVGADFDFDAIATECASLDALRQRFGRLNRLGVRPGSRGVIAIRSDQVRTEEEIANEPPEKKDPIYGDSLPRTWNWLSNHAQPSGNDRVDQGRVIDFGIAAFERILPEEPETLSSLQAPSSAAPVMLPAHVDCWVQTAPHPEPDPDVALFLHGPDRGQPEVQVCLREDLSLELPEDQREARWVDAVALCPPTAAECLPVPLGLARDWLLGKEQHTEETSDLEDGPPAPRLEETEARRAALRWRGPDSDDTGLVRDVGEIGPGDTLVIPSDESGWRSLGQFPQEDQSSENRVGLIDIAEQAFRIARRRALLRLHPSLMKKWPVGLVRDEFHRIACEEEFPAEATGELRGALRALASSEDYPDWLRLLTSDLASDSRMKILLHPDHPANAPPAAREDESSLFTGGLVLVGSRLLPPIGDEEGLADTATTEDDTASGTVSVPLDVHNEGVATMVDRFARCCGVPEPQRLALVCAARSHDLGKADQRFQAWLHNGNILAAGLAPCLLAKSGGLAQGRRERELAREKSGYPKGARHELISVRLIESSIGSGVIEPEVDSDLVLHLIASHHGHARPFVPVVEDREPVEVSIAQNGKVLRASSATELHRLESGVAERFWSLVRRYGWWKLAWLESLLRLADHRCSEHEQARLQIEERPEEIPQ